MNKPLLSVCIPTYNRCAYLQNTLNSIICQKEFQEGMVEVVISDNASTDGTGQLAGGFASRYGNIRYFKNPENIRDKNFPLALSRGKGVYRKLYNDTLLCRPGSLSYICSLIKQYIGTEEIFLWINGKGKNFKEEMAECANFEQFVRTAGIWTGWIGAFGLWESECEDITADVSGCELMLWQCQKIYKMAEAKGQAVVINRMLFFNQEVTRRDLSYGLYQVLHLNYLAILNGYVEKGLIDRQTYETIRIENLYRFAYFLIRGEQKRHQWNISDEESIKDVVLNEVKEAGIWEEYQRYYKKAKLFFKMRTDLKVIFLKIYCPYLAFRAHAVDKHMMKTGDNH